LTIAQASVPEGSAPSANSAGASVSTDTPAPPASGHCSPSAPVSPLPPLLPLLPPTLVGSLVVEPAELVAPLVGLSVDVPDSPAPDVVLALPVPTLAPAVDSPPEPLPLPQPSPQIHNPATNQTRVISDGTTRQFTRQSPPLDTQHRTINLAPPPSPHAIRPTIFSNPPRANPGTLAP
jgi:hypothetical protein